MNLESKDQLQKQLSQPLLPSSDQNQADDSEVELHECGDKCGHSALNPEDMALHIVRELQELRKDVSSLHESSVRLQQSMSRMAQSISDLGRGVSQLGQAMMGKNGSLGQTHRHFHPKAQIASSKQADCYQPTSSTVDPTLQNVTCVSLIPPLKLDTQENKTETASQIANSLDSTAQQTQPTPK